MFKNFLSLCPFCESPAQADDFLCEECRKAIQAYYQIPKCVLCGQPTQGAAFCSVCSQTAPKFNLSISCAPYHKQFQNGFLQYKFHKSYHRVKGFSRLMLENFQKLGVKADCITVVGTNVISELSRSYQSPLEMAYLIRRSLKLPLYPKLLRKKLSVKQQSKLPKKERLPNVKNAFRIHPRLQNKIKGKDVLLIDDVYTTGATANECSRLLKKYGAKSVYVLTLLGSSQEHT